MRIWTGKAISPGYAQGRAVVFRSKLGRSASRRELDPEEAASELERFCGAVRNTAEALDAVVDRVASSVGRAEAAIFKVHASLLRDPTLTKGVERRISVDLVNAEFALEQEIEEMAARLDELPSREFRERATDIRDLGRRLLAQLLGRDENVLANLPPGTVLVADELMPSHTIHLDRTNVFGIVSERSGRTSHSAILAKALGIPAVSDLPGLTKTVRDGDMLLVDGISGTLTVRPDAAASQRFEAALRAYVENNAKLAAETKDCTTPDGVRVTLLANLGRASEAKDVRARGLEGVGLFRTEILFLDHEVPPTFEEHRETYLRAALDLAGLPLVIRTLDLGGDKRPPFIPAVSSHNPTLGLRGLRFALREGKLLRRQLAAIVDVAREHPVKVLFPMVLGGSDLRAAVAVLREVAAEAGLSDSLPPVGAMIETPASLFSLDEIVEIADFLSLGTNDLTQFMLAADRDAVELIDDYSILHPSVLRALRQVLERAERAERPVTLCGEAAGDPALAPLLVGLGVRSLSMSPMRATAVRRALRETECSRAARAADELLSCEGLEAARECLARSELGSKT